MTELPERRPSRQMAVSAIGGAFAALLGCVFLPAGPDAAAMATAGLAPYTTRMIDLAAGEWRRKSELVAETALTASGIDEEEFCARLSGNPELIGLSQKILWAASMSGNEHKLRTFGQLLGGAVKNHGDRLGEGQLLAAALTDLEAPHAVVLDVLTQPAPGTVAGDKEPWSWWSLAQIEAATPMDDEFVLACLSTLVTHGLAKTASGYGGGGDLSYALSPLGRALAAVMSQARASPRWTEHSRKAVAGS